MQNCIRHRCFSWYNCTRDICKMDALRLVDSLISAVGDGLCDEEASKLIARTEVLLTGLRVRQRMHIQLQELKQDDRERNERLSRFSNSRCQGTRSWLPYPPPSGLPQQAGIPPVIFGPATLHDMGAAASFTARSSQVASSEHLAIIGVVEDLQMPPACAHRCSHLPFPLPATLPAKRPLTLSPSRTTSTPVTTPGCSPCPSPCVHTTSNSCSPTSFSERGRAYVQSRALSPGPSVGLALQPMTLTLRSVTPTSRLSPVTSATIGIAEEWSYVRTHELRSTSSAVCSLSGKQKPKALQRIGARMERA